MTSQLPSSSRPCALRVGATFCNREEKRRGKTQQVSHTCIFSEKNETKWHKERKETGSKK
jgi:hypothetical protein